MKTVCGIAAPKLYRTICLALCLALCLAAVSCSKQDEPSETAPASGPPTGLTPVIQPKEDVASSDSPEGAPKFQPRPDDRPQAAQSAQPAQQAQQAQQAQSAPPADDKSKAAGPTPLDGSRQVVIVVTGGWKDFKGKMLRIARPSLTAPFSLVESRWPCVVGKNGLAWGRGVFPTKPEEPAKREGDGRSPAGVFRLGDMFGSENAKLVKTLGLKMPYLKLEQTHICINDPASATFNKIVDSAKTAKTDFKRYERMLRSDKANRWGVFIEHNPAPITPDAGSCVFLNIWASPAVPTGGSTGISEPDMRELLLWLDPSAKPLLIQLPAPELAKFKDAWRLPAGLVR